MISIGIVTWNSSKYIKRCLDSIFKQTLKDYEVMVIDNNSTDDTLDQINEFSDRIIVLRNEKNIGFCAAHNRGILLSNGEYYLPFNPDIIADNDYLRNMLDAILLNNHIGMVSGKLLRLNPLTMKATNIIDSTGIYFKRNRRCLDRGSEVVDKNQYNKKEYVFGASGAAPLYRKKMLNDICVDGEYFFSDFFAYREDVDLAWRAQLRNWSCIYNPNAIAYHVRTNTPKKRSLMSAFVNMHSVKNRIIMLIQNESFYGLLMHGWIYIPYEIMIFIYVCFLEQESLAAYRYVIKNWALLLRRRKFIQSKKKTKDIDILKWFGGIKSQQF